ncbi:MAG TPA: hypothetical protein VGH28_16655 [Polyangiaceae bacterium]|jgi:hypothetical protein
MSSAGIPVVFSAPRSIRLLNVVAVATSIAACTIAAGVAVSPADWSCAIYVGLPTVFVAYVWALCLRWQKETGSGRRWGWFLSVPLAAMNAAMACGTMFALQGDASPEAFGGGAILGATFGVIVWLPAMFLVLALFGLPIAHAQKLARRGLTGEERGERIIGLVAALLAALALPFAWLCAGTTHMPNGPTAWMGAALMHVFSFVAIGCGVVAALRAATRERRRERFVARVEALEEPGYRVEPTPAGKVLVRVAPVATYRVSDRAEELFELDDAGRATYRASTLS